MATKKPKSSVISFRVPIEEREAFEKSAIEAGTTLAGYIHATLVEARSGKKAVVAAPAPSPLAPPVHVPGIALSDPAALAELKRIGININQIAHAANAGLPPNHRTMVEAFAGLFGLLTEPERFMRRLAEINVPLDAAHALPAKPAVPTPAPKPAALPSSPSASPRDLPRPLATSPWFDVRPSPSTWSTLAAKTPVNPPKPTPPPVASKPLVAPSPPKPVPAQSGTASARPVPPPAPIKRPEAPASATTPARPPSAPKSRGLRHRRPGAAAKASRHDSPNPQARHELQDRRGVHPARPAEGNERPGRLGFLRKLWGG